MCRVAVEQKVALNISAEPRKSERASVAQLDAGHHNDRSNRKLIAFQRTTPDLPEMPTCTTPGRPRDMQVVLQQVAQQPLMDPGSPLCVTVFSAG